MLQWQNTREDASAKQKDCASKSTKSFCCGKQMMHRDRRKINSPSKLHPDNKKPPKPQLKKSVQRWLLITKAQQTQREKQVRNKVQVVRNERTAKQNHGEANTRQTIKWSQRPEKLSREPSPPGLDPGVCSPPGSSPPAPRRPCPRGRRR